MVLRRRIYNDTDNNNALGFVQQENERADEENFLMLHHLRGERLPGIEEAKFSRCRGRCRSVMQAKGAS